MKATVSVLLVGCACASVGFGSYAIYMTWVRSDSGCGFLIGGGAILIGGVFSGLALLHTGGEERRGLLLLGWIVLGLSLLPVLLLAVLVLFPSLVPGP